MALVALVAYQMWPEPTRPRLRGPDVQSEDAGGQGAARHARLDPAELKVRLEALEAKRPDFDDGRAEPVPVPAAAGTAATDSCRRSTSRLVPVGPPPAPPPPPIPPIPLKFMGTVEKPGLTAGGADRLQRILVRGAGR